MLEKLLRHLMELGLRGGRDNHAEIEGVAFELRLHGERLDFLRRLVADEHLLGRLEDVGILGGKITACRGRRLRGAGQAQEGEAGGGAAEDRSHENLPWMEGHSRQQQSAVSRRPPTAPATATENHGGEVGRISSYSDVSSWSPWRDGMMTRSSFISSRQKILRNLVM